MLSSRFFREGKAVFLRRTGIVKDQRYLSHGLRYHQESPARLEAIYAMIEQPDKAGHFTEIAPRFADGKEIERIHNPAYIELVASTVGKSHFTSIPIRKPLLNPMIRRDWLSEVSSTPLTTS